MPNKVDFAVGVLSTKVYSMAIVLKSSIILTGGDASNQLFATFIFQNTTA